METKEKSRRRSEKPQEQLKIAGERMEILFEEAGKAVEKDRALANRYVALARRIGMRYNLSIPPQYRKHVCRKCKKYMYPGITARFSAKKGSLRKECLQCMNVSRIRLRKRL